jgi:protoporphyrinogen oxidase
MLADHLADRHREVLVLESEPECGGLLRSFDYGEHGRFDYGTHILSETGDAALDSYLVGLLPQEEWTFLRGNRRDLAGLFFNGRLQLHTSYPDLTTLSPDAYRACLGDFFASLSEDDGSGAGDARDYLRRRFGRVIADTVGAPIVEKFAGAPAASLGLLVVRLCPLNRMALFGRSLSHEVSRAPLLGSRVAWIDQREIPDAERSSRAAFYPRRRGVNRAVLALVDRLRAKGVAIQCSQRIQSLRDSAEALVVELHDGRQVAAEHLYWSAHVLGLAPILGVPIDFACMDKPLSSVLCHFVLDRPSAMADLYYMYCADPAFKTYRVTNYAAYCPDPEPGSYAVTVELLLGDEDVRAGGFEERALAELRQMGVVAPTAAVRFSRAEVLRYGFPRPTLANAREMDRVRDRVRERVPRRLSLFGIGSREGLFFMTDVLRDTFDFLQGRRA